MAQDGILRRVVDPPAASRMQASTGGLPIRRRFTTCPQCIPPLFFKVELEHDADENPQRIGDEIRRHLKKLFGVRDVELSNITSEEE